MILNKQEKKEYAKLEEKEKALYLADHGKILTIFLLTMKERDKLAEVGNGEMVRGLRLILSKIE